jgi:hypothetical protein
MKTTDLNIAPFHKVDMSSYLSDPRYESVMIPLLSFTVEYCQDAIVNSADRITINNELIDCILDEISEIVSIEGYCHMWLNRANGYEPFYLPKWFLVSLLQEECKRGAFDLIPFTISLIRECK